MKDAMFAQRTVLGIAVTPLLLLLVTTITIAAETAQTKKKRGGKCDMALTVTKMTRVFQFNGIRLPDPNPEMSVDNVKALYSAQYPELTTAVVNGPEAVGDKMRYTFDRAIGSKG